MTREEYLRKKRNQLGKNYSDEYDDEDYSDEQDSDWANDTTRQGVGINTTRNRIAPVVFKPGEDLKSAADREEYIRRMNKLAHGFHFYSMDKQESNKK